MKRLAIITVGKTHSGKTTFAKALENHLCNSLVIDQDNHAEFLNTYYRKLQPQKGPNTLKHLISKQIVGYAREYTDFHMIICNSNRSRKDRLYLLEELFHQAEFFRVIVHFDIPDEVLQNRVLQSSRSTNIFRGENTTFEEILKRQQADSQKEDVSDPVEGEADRLFVINDSADTLAVIKEIFLMAEAMGGF